MQALQIVISGMAQGCIYGLIALGLVLIYKTTETVSFAQGELMMLGAFAGFALMTLAGWPFWLAVPTTIVVLALFGFGLERIVIRPILGQPAFSLVMLTIGIGYVARGLVTMIPAIGTETHTLPVPYKDQTWNVGGLVLNVEQMVVIAATALLSALLYAMFRYSKIGIAMQASSQVARMKAAGCDFVLLGTIIRETIGTIAESRKAGFSPTFMGTSASYTDLIHKLGGKAMDGLYATMTVQNPYLDEASKQISFWAAKYKTKFNEDPTVFSIYGYNAIDAFARAAAKAGANLTTDTFIKAMDSMSFESDMFGSAPSNFTPTKHLGSDASRLSQLQDGRWKVVSDYIKPN